MWKCSRCDTLVVVFMGFLKILEVSTSFNTMNPNQFPGTVWSPERSRLISRDLECSRPDFYVCEEPPESPIESGKLCNYRGVLYTEQVYRWVAGRGCLLYTPDFLYVNGTNTINLNSACLLGTTYAPCVELIKSDGTCGCFPFDPGFPEVVQAVEEAILQSAHGRWERCYQAAADCCTNIMSDADVLPEPGYCGATFDGWACWEAAKVNTVVAQVCPEFAYTNVGPTCQHFSTKNCTETGTWDIQTDFSTCSVSPRLIRRNRYYIWVLAASTAACVPAICVFFFYKRLRVTRVALHRNLLIAIVFRNVLVIVTRSEIYLDELMNASDTTLGAHEWPCRVLAVCERIAVNFVFVCMLVEGIYLHRLICAVFRKQLNIALLYGIGTVISLVPVAVWATVMALLDDHSCWLIYTVPGVQWTLDAPRIAILIANTILFADILRVLLTKIRNSENQNQLSTAKATLFLMPLFGVQFLLTAYRPTTDSCSVEQGYYVFVYAMEGIQGVLVAILYCYANKEVHNLVKQTYRKTEDAIVSRVRRDSNYRRSTLGGASSNRRETYSTNLDNPHLSPQPIVFKEAPLSEPKRYVSVLDPISEAGVDNDAFNIAEIPEDIHYSQAVNPLALSSASSAVFNASDISESDSGYSPPDNTIEVDSDSKTSTGKTDETIECHEWIKCVSSPSSSIYENSLNEYEIKYLENKIPMMNACKSKPFNDEVPFNQIIANDEEHNFPEIETVDDNDLDNVSFSDFIIPERLVDGMDGSKIFEEVMREASSKKEDGVHFFNSNVLSPNRLEADKIVFVDE